MKIGFLLDPLESLKEHKDTSVLMMRTAAARGHEVHAIPHESVSLRSGELQVEHLELEIRPEGEDWFRVTDRHEGSWGDKDPIVIRKDPPFDMAYLTCVRLLELGARSGIPVHNSPAALARSDEKLATLRYPDLAPETLVTCSADRIRDFHAQHGGCVLKPLGLMGGRGVYQSAKGDPNLASVSGVLTAGGTRKVIAQEPVAAAAEGDKRVLVVAGEPQPYMLRRKPMAGDFRGNVDAGAETVAEPLGKDERAAAERVAPDLVRDGIQLAGLDMLGDRLTEINITSPTCMREIRDQTGHDCSEPFIKLLECAA